MNRLLICLLLPIGALGVMALVYHWSQQAYDADMARCDEYEFPSVQEQCRWDTDRDYQVRRRQ